MIRAPILGALALCALASMALAQAPPNGGGPFVPSAPSIVGNNIAHGNLVMGGVWGGDSSPSNSLIYAEPPGTPAGTGSNGITGTCTNNGNACGVINILAGIGVTASGYSAANGQNIPVLLQAVGYIDSAQSGGYSTANFVTVLRTQTAMVANKFYQGGNAGMLAIVNDNGTMGSPSGSLFGWANYCVAEVPGTAYFVACTALENDTAILASNNVNYSYNSVSVLLAVNANAALLDSAAFAMGSQVGGAQTWACGLCTGANNSPAGLATTADFIAHHGAGAAPNITNGINMSNWTFSGQVMSWPNGNLDHFGNLTLAAGSLIFGAAGLIYMNNLTTPLSSPAAATFQLGAANAAAPIAQTLSTQGSRAGTDTNVAGGNLSVVAGVGTGNAAVSVLNLQSPVAVASGSGAQTIKTGLQIKNGQAVLTGYTVATLPAGTQGGQTFVTDAVACTFLATLTGGGSTVCPVFYTGTAWVGA